MIVSRFPRRAAARAGFVLTVGIGLCASADRARADRLVSGFVKPTSTTPFTSWTVQTTNPATTADPVPGWTRTKVGPKEWRYTNNTTPIGGTFTVNLSGAGGTNGQVVAGDYTDANGRTVWVGTCLDPIGYRVVSGGATGTSYLGYNVPAGQYGYFYQMYNPAGYGGISKTATIGVGAASGATNFQVLASAFAFLPTAGFDLQDLALPDINRLDDTYAMQQYMEPLDAVAAASLAGIVPVSWSFNAVTGDASLTFEPGNAADGLGAAESSAVVAYTSPFGPGLTDSTNVSTSFVNTFGCPPDYILVPLVPEPSLAALALATVLATARRRGRR